LGSSYLPAFFLPTHLPPSSCSPSPHPQPPFALTSISKASNQPRESLSSSEF
jgi:hypothetical protein